MKAERVRACLAVLPLMLLALAACGTDGAPASEELPATPAPEPTVAAAPATEVPAEPTATATPEPAPTSTATAVPARATEATAEPTATATPGPAPTSTATAAAVRPTEVPVEPTAEPTPTPVPTPTPMPTPTPEPTPAPDPAGIVEAAFTRFNEQRQALGLEALIAVAEGDDSFMVVQRFVVGCHASADEYEELLGADIEGIGLSPSQEGTECGLRVVTYRAGAEPAPSEPGDTPEEPTETPTPEPTPTPDPEDIVEAALSRFNEQRQALGLGALRAAVEGDVEFIPVEEFAVGCYESAGEFAELTRSDIHGIGLSLRTEGTECGLDVVTYHVVPVDQRMRVERRIWECFSESRDIREASDISCGGRFSFLGKHVKWLPANVLYFLQEGEALREDFRSHIPWIEDKLGVEVSEAGSAEAAHLILHLGVQSPANCPERYGCSVLEELDGRTFATVYISAPQEFFSQVLKHELLHALLPMGHLPQGNYLMSVRPDDPSQTHALAPDEERLLALYTHPYLRDGMTMEQFQRYLVIE